MEPKNQDMLLCLNCGRIPLIQLQNDNSKNIDIVCEQCIASNMSIAEYLYKLKEIPPNCELCCKEHNNQSFNSYCVDCKKNLCPMCDRKKHATHYELKYDKFLSENKKEDKENKINDAKVLINYIYKQKKDIYVNYLKNLINVIDLTYNDFIRRNNEMLNLFELAYKNYNTNSPVYHQIKNYYELSDIEFPKFDKIPENFTPTSKLEYLDDLLDYFKTTNIKIIPQKNVEENILSKYYVPVPLEFSYIEQSKSFETKDPISYMMKLQSNDFLTIQKNTIKVYNEAFEVKCVKEDAHKEKILDACQLPSGNILTCSSDSVIKIWSYSPEGKTLNLVKQIENPHGENNSIYKMINISGNRFCSCGNNNVINVYNSDTYELITTLKGHTSSIVNLIQMKSGLLASLGNYDNLLKFWNLDNYSCVNTIENVDSIFNNSIIEIEGNKLLVGEFYYIKLIDCNSFKIIKKAYNGSYGNAMCFCLLKDNSVLVGGDDGAIYKIDKNTLAYEKTNLLAHNDFICSLTNINTNKFASVSHDGFIKIFQF